MKETDDNRQARLAGDLAMAEYICREIRNDHPQALSELYDTYHVFFEKFTLKRTQNHELTLDVLQDFWENLLDGNDICGYQAQNGISLKSYLTRRLYFRTIDAFRRTVRYQQRFIREDSDDPDQPDRITRAADAAQSQPAEYEHPDHDRIDTLYAAMDELSSIRPTDAWLIRQIMMGHTYDEIAAQQGADTEDAIKRKRTALRQQYVRAKTRLRVLIERQTAAER